jgi:hypothetical protein
MISRFQKVAVAQRFKLQFRPLSDAIKSEIQKTIDSHKVCVFMKGNQAQPQCGFSKGIDEIILNI